ncbi:sensor histidine kinase, partial [Tenggerimyces flavus]|uniref:sensor histidine kinase n=1 Tax=Tenggerimyces flavus TaxID=1708749 RepID=UPI00196139D2
AGSALTTPDGQIIADSARLLGESVPRLPANPAATLDVISGDTLGASSLRVGVAGKAYPAVSYAVTSVAKYLGGGLWGLTPAEEVERQSLVQKANECLAAQYPSAAVQVNIDGYPVEVRSNSSPVAAPTEGPSAGVTEDVLSRITAQESNCVPPELYRPSEQALAYNRAETRLTSQCLDGYGVTYSLEKGPDGLQAIRPDEVDLVKAKKWETTKGSASKPVPVPEPTERAESSAPTAKPEPGTTDRSDSGAAAGGGGEQVAQRALDAFSDCYTTSRAQALQPYVAPTALLYLGSSERFDAFSADGWWRTASTALAVLVVAAGITLLGGQRLVRPIRALTTAAQRMEAGDRAARVPVQGADEVARLGHAFNSMASAIESGEQQRRALVSDVAHELRTPLANVRGYLEAAEDGVVELDSALVRSLLEEASLLERLVTDLQMLAQADAGMLRIYPEECDASDLTAQVVAAHRAAAEAAGVRLTAQAPSSSPIHADPHRIRQALSNLVANALRFTPSGGSVVVAVELEGRQVVWSVSDTGPGIGEEHLPHLFDRFYRADPSRSRATGGSGLGLAIVRHLVEAHGGQVEVASEVGRGSTFVIRLPVSTATS